MLSEREMAFVKHWELVRVRESSFLNKFLKGLPVAFLSGIPVLVLIALVYFFSHDWFTKISQRAAGSSGPILVALFIFILAFSFVRMHFKWEMNEQLYLELKSRRSRSIEI